MKSSKSNKMTLSKNMGNTDSVLRVVLGVGILVAGLMSYSWWALIGLIPLLTGIMSWCPIYKVFGIRTCKADLEQEV